jgi:hypothetical protein
MNVSSLASFSAPVTAVSSFLIFWVMGTRAKLVTA